MVAKFRMAKSSLVTLKYSTIEVGKRKSSSLCQGYKRIGLFLLCFAIWPFICLLLLLMETLWYWKLRNVTRPRKYVKDHDGQQSRPDYFEIFNY